MEEKHIVKQIIIRLYGAPLDKLKATLREINSMPNVKPELFGKDNEFIVSITAESGGEAAATALCESAANKIEEALGDDVYARGENSLAHAAAGALIRNTAQLCAADEELGLLLEEEFKTTKRAEHIFDYGEFTYRSLRRKKLELPRKIAVNEGASSLAAAQYFAAMARKTANVRYGAALTPPDENGYRWIAVADKKQTYARQLQAGENARAGALAVLDLVRRLSDNPSLESSAMPARQKARSKANIYALTAAAISLIFSLLAAGGIYYVYENYYIPLQPQYTQAFK